jgi:hypothetical protein
LEDDELELEQENKAKQFGIISDNPEFFSGLKTRV